MNENSELENIRNLVKVRTPEEKALQDRMLFQREFMKKLLETREISKDEMISWANENGGAISNFIDSENNVDNFEVKKLIQEGKYTEAADIMLYFWNQRSDKYKGDFEKVA